MSSNRRVEVRSRINELTKEMLVLNAELKEIDREDARVRARDAFSEYRFKVGTYRYKIEGEEKVVEATDADREAAEQALSGLVYSGFNEQRTFGFVLLKSKEDYARTKKTLVLIDAAEHLRNEKEPKRQEYLKVLLGETESVEE